MSGWVCVVRAIWVGGFGSVVRVPLDGSDRLQGAGYVV